HSKGNELTTAQLTAALIGDPQSFSLNELTADWLDGTLAGQVRAGWTDGWQLQGQLNGNNLNPQLVYEQLDGRLNLGIDFAFAGGKNVDPQGQLELRIIDSVLHEQPLAGNAAVQVDGANMLIEHLHLYGEGLSLEAEGDPSERLDVSWQIENLEQFLPDLQGNFAGKGWLRWQQNLLSGQVSAIGVQLGFKKWQLEQLKLDGGPEGDQNSWRFQLSGLNLTQDGKKLVDSWAAKLNGSIENHKLILMANEQNNHLDLSFVGGWHDQQWQGSLNKFQLDDTRIGQWQLDKATGLLFSRPLVQVEPLLLRGESNQTIKLQGDFQPLEQLADTKVRWWNLDLSRFSFLLADTQIIGHSSGHLKLKKSANSSLHAEMTITGGLQWQQQLLQISQGNFLLDWIDNNLTGTVHLQLENGGRMNGKVTSTKAPAFKLPSQLQLQLTSSEFPLLMVQPWVPTGFNLTGMLDWELVGQWRSTGLIDMTGWARTANVGLSWEGENGNLSADIVASELKLEWHEQLVAELLIQLRERGVVTADLQIPVAAEIPFKIDSKTPVAADLQANLHERGLLSLLFPGQVQETQGELSLDLQLAGFLQKPIFQGEFQLYSGGAFLPSLGVKLDDIEIDGDFNDNLLSLTGMQIRSGEGDLHGSGQLELRNWQPGHYNLLLEGKDFQLINLPEMQARINPDLKIAGTGSEIKVRGDLIFPEVVVIGSTKNKLAGKSSDLVIVDAEKPPPRQQKVTHDIDIQVDLKQILVNASGLDAKLAGGMRLYSADNQKDIAANGKIKIIKGKFSSYGVNLDIDHGGIYFSGPVNQPTLDILALRTVDDVQAGVKVSGTPQLPEVDLYSKPFMPDTDILAYIVLGRPFSAEGSDTGLLMRAAGVLLSGGESAMLQQKLKGRLGLDVLDFSAGGGDIHDSVITTGKYLNPDLYVSLGHSLFKNTNEVNIRYSLTPSWELESDIGVESGVDLYYKIEIK
ncbi:MAG: translocation/assembly module TamB domain-containing protein, partial [Pseudomonadota bacterium]|nr:translocation/assembly module TamB domain-containing protein [Pseudomonadota bacterium]